MTQVTLDNFRLRIGKKILERGEEYYEQGAVLSLNEREPGMFIGKVSGSNTYHVRILLDDNDVLESSCSCPYNREDVCKHIVAVLCALHDGERDIKSATGGRGLTDAVEEKLKMMLRDELIAVIAGARSGESVDRIVKSAYADDREWEDIRYVKSIVRDAVNSASDRYGGISYGSTLDAVEGAQDVLENAKEFELARPHAATVCCMAVIEVLSPVLMSADDSDGDISGVVSEAFELLARIACTARDSGNEILRKEIFEYALKEWSKKRYEGWDCPELFLTIAADIAQSISEERLFEVSLTKYTLPVSKSQTEESSFGIGISNDSYMMRYRKERVAELRLRTLMRLHADQVDAFLLSHIELYPMRKVAIERALSRGSTEEARLLAHEGIRQAEKDKYPGYVSDYRDVLMRCAEREGDKEGAYGIAIQLFLDSHMEPFSYYRRAKKFAGSTWHTRLPEVISVLAKKRGKHGDLYKLANLYIEEKVWQELLMLVENNPELSSAYGKRLEKRFPKETAHVYALMVQKGMDIPGGRSAYQAQCDILRTIRNLGCPELVEHIVSVWREQYPRRRALMEELDRL